MRAPDKAQDGKRGHREARHGYELRFRTYSNRELAEVLRLLHTVGIPTGRPYPVSSNGTAVSVYGKQRTLSAIRDLRLKRPPVRVMGSRPKRRRPKARRLRFTSLRQLEVAMMMYGRRPMTARKINTTPTLLAAMQRRRLVWQGYNWSEEKTWALTLRGKKQTRHGRVAYLEWLRSGKRIGLSKR